MNPTLLKDFPAWSAKYEGWSPYMYLDVKCIVTFGIGHAAFSPDTLVRLPWYHKDTDVPATEAQIRNEWVAVRDNKMLAKHGMFNGHAAAFTRLRLTGEAVFEDTRTVLKYHHKELVEQYPALESWPLDAQWATHSMAWACGEAFSEPGPNRFTNLARKLKVLGDGDGDFAAAALECHMNEAGNPGLKPRNISNKMMYRNAQYVRDHNLDHERLWWPKDLSAMSVSEEEEFLDAIRTESRALEPVAVSLPEVSGEGGPIPIIRNYNSYFPERNET